MWLKRKGRSKVLGGSAAEPGPSPQEVPSFQIEAESRFPFPPKRDLNISS